MLGTYNWEKSPLLNFACKDNKKFVKPGIYDNDKLVSPLHQILVTTIAIIKAL